MSNPSKTTSAIYPLGVFYLHGYKVQSSSDSSKKHGIQLVPTNPQHKFICLAADTEIDKKR